MYFYGIHICMVLTAIIFSSICWNRHREWICLRYVCLVGQKGQVWSGSLLPNNLWATYICWFQCVMKRFRKVCWSSNINTDENLEEKSKTRPTGGKLFSKWGALLSSELLERFHRSLCTFPSGLQSTDSRSLNHSVHLYGITNRQTFSIGWTIVWVTICGSKDILPVISQDLSFAVANTRWTKPTYVSLHLIAPRWSGKLHIVEKRRTATGKISKILNGRNHRSFQDKLANVPKAM